MISPLVVILPYLFVALALVGLGTVLYFAAKDAKRLAARRTTDRPR